jgi:hypothetical protein
MKITTQKELDEAREIVLEMKAQTTNGFVISVLDMMLEELDTKGIECYTPTYFSILSFGYDIFQPLRRI